LSKIEHLSKSDLNSAPIFLPYLSGERTPHNNPNASGTFFGMTNNTNKAVMGYSVIEGVAFGLKDGLNALRATGTNPTQLALVGGGSRSELWAQLISSILDITIVTYKSGEAFGALGAARLGALATGANQSDICFTPEIAKQYTPNTILQNDLEKRYDKYKQLYKQLNPIF
jgi:xylulokinase